jgi:hypothetical protein
MMTSIIDEKHKKNMRIINTIDRQIHRDERIYILMTLTNRFRACHHVTTPRKPIRSLLFVANFLAAEFFLVYKFPLLNNNEQTNEGSVNPSFLKSF